MTGERSFSGLIDATQRVTAAIEFVIDLSLPEMLHAKLVRSTFAHARIINIDVSHAQRVDGVHAVIVGTDIDHMLGMYPHFGPIFRDQPILAIDKVRYVGEPVAAVVAHDARAALEAARLVEVEYEALPEVFDVEAALASGAPALHVGERRVGALLASDIVSEQRDTNVCNHFRLRKGAAEDALERAAHLFENTFETPPLQHVSLEPHACVVVTSGEYTTIWTGTQTPFRVRDEIAHVLGCPPGNVRVIVPPVGGAYGNKCYPKIEPVTVALAKATGRPVKLVLSREEDSVTLTRHGSRITLTTGVDDEGRIVARKALCLFNTGAYADIGPRVIKNGGSVSAGPYAIANVSVDSYAVYTNLPPAGAFRGYGAAQAAWAYESQMDVIADHLNIDPVELRMRNVLRDGDTFATGEVMVNCRYADLIRCAAESVAWTAGGGQSASAASRARGKGIACCIKAMVTPSVSEATVELGRDGVLSIMTSSVDIGQGVHTALAILGAEGLGIDARRVRVSTPDTDVTPYDQQTSSSRSTHCMGSAVLGAIDTLREELFDGASAVLGIARTELRLKDGCIVHARDPAVSISLGEIAARSDDGRLAATGRYETTGVLDPATGQGVAAAHWHQAAVAADVEVDVETGAVEVLRLEAVAYAGRVVNPVMAELQTEGNLAFGLGQALYEEMTFDSGQLLNPNLSEYMIPSIADMPQLGVHLLEDACDDPEIQGLGETALPAVSPAIANAVADAIGKRITALPLTPEKVLAALRASDDAQRTAEGEARS